VGRVALGFVGTVLLLDGIVLAASLVARRAVGRPPVPSRLSGLRNAAAVDEVVWRGGAPSEAQQRLLAQAGVEVVVDLRAERSAPADHAGARSAGMRVVHLPVRDGQTPSADQVRRLLAVVADADGPVYLHCGAGVGRTGAAAAAYLLRTGQASPVAAVARNLAVGPPSLEQLAYVGLGADGPPRWPIVAVSRIVDAPRRAWSRVRGWRGARRAGRAS
jgi:protein-tyrosine phosphatase